MLLSSTLERYSPPNITGPEERLIMAIYLSGGVPSHRASCFNILCAGLNWQVAMAANEEPTDGVEQSSLQILYQGKIKLMLLASKRRIETTPSNRHLKLSLALIQNEK